jgi:hypothetical protein
MDSDDITFVMVIGMCLLALLILFGMLYSEAGRESQQCKSLCGDAMVERFVPSTEDASWTCECAR